TAIVAAVGLCFVQSTGAPVTYGQSCEFVIGSVAAVNVTLSFAMIDVTYGLFARNAICLPVRFASRPSIELNCWRICAAVAPAGPLSPVICLYRPLELPFLSPWTMTSYVAFGFCWMALVSALGTYALRLARPGS